MSKKSYANIEILLTRDELELVQAALVDSGYAWRDPELVDKIDNALASLKILLDRRIVRLPNAYEA